jgi:hypothetical protein
MKLVVNAATTVAGDVGNGAGQVAVSSEIGERTTVDVSRGLQGMSIPPSVSRTP